MIGAIMDAHLWKIYCDPYFKFDKIIELNDFVVITASNPKSVKLSDGENSIRNKHLSDDLQHFHPVKLWVGNYDFSWFEEGFAAQISLSIAVELAHKYQQNAIYFVQDGQLFLLSCRSDKTQIDLGEWCHRLR
ncbi:DUF3293 domain-containing protein [Vibrio scophthalmi]|uniref:DUF3293 domain-containing protein n=1 Tax=Vibrio scophthalmi TaxID=45658 RepID=UPI003EB7961A